MSDREGSPQDYLGLNLECQKKLRYTEKKYTFSLQSFFLFVLFFSILFRGAWSISIYERCSYTSVRAQTTRSDWFFGSIVRILFQFLYCISPLITILISNLNWTLCFNSFQDAADQNTISAAKRCVTVCHFTSPDFPEQVAQALDLLSVPSGAKIF